MCIGILFFVSGRRLLPSLFLQLSHGPAAFIPIKIGFGSRAALSPTVFAGLEVDHAASGAMPLPFEVELGLEDLSIYLWALRQAPGADEVYRREALRKVVMAFLSTKRFIDLGDAVRFALARQKPVVHLLRNVTLPCPSQTGNCVIWWSIPSDSCVTLVSRGGPWRIRHSCPDANSGAYGFCFALFALGRGARLFIRDVHFEAVRQFDHPAYVAIVGMDQGAGVVDMPDDVQTVGYIEVIKACYRDVGIAAGTG